MAATKEDILAALAEFVAEETGLPGEQVTEDKSFTDDLDVDSLSMMTIIAMAEDRFDVKVPDEDAKDLVTVGDAADYIAKQQA